MNRGIIVDDFARKHINEICGCQKSFIPEFEGHTRMSKKS
jgi:hypothetical protein